MKALIISILVLFGVAAEEQEESTFYQQVEWSCLTDTECIEECILAADEVGVDREVCYEI